MIYKGEFEMADIRDEIHLCDEIEFNDESDQDTISEQNTTKEEFVEEKNNLPVLAKQGFWARFKAFWFQEIELSEIIKKQLNNTFRKKNAEL